MYKLITALGLSLAIAGCNQPAGNSLDGGTFGNATLNNSLVMSGELDYAISLGRRFAEQVPTTVNFEFNSSQIDVMAQQTLNKQADWIRQFPEIRFRVYGYTDLVGSTYYNKRLGQRRADAVVSYLVSQGINRSRLEAVVSYGKTRPVIDTPGPERENRRSVTEVKGFVKRHPTVLDGKYAQIVYRDYVESATVDTTLTGRSNSGGFTEEQ